MLMKNYFKKLVFGCIIGASIMTIGCQSSQQLIDPSLSLKARESNDPRFLDGIAMAGNSSNIKITTPKSTVRNHNEIVPSITNMLQLKYASVLGVVPQAITNLSLYNFIEDWYGVRYRLGGNDKNGIDCSAFVQTLYDNVFCTDLVRTAFQQFLMCKTVWSADSLKEGDLVFFKTRGKRISHVGIYLMNDRFVHASSSQGVIISSLNESYWSRSYAGAGKIPTKESSF